MSQLKRLIQREVRSRRETLTGTVIEARELQQTDGTGDGSPRWVVKVEVGKNHFLSNVPVKASGSGARYYADLGLPVALHRNTQGQFEVVGPGDRVSAPIDIRTYGVDGAETSQTDEGFTYEILPFSHYQTADPDLTNPLTQTLWADGITPFNFIRIVDADGIPVP